MQKYFSPGEFGQFQAQKWPWARILAKNGGRGKISKNLIKIIDFSVDTVRNTLGN